MVIVSNGLTFNAPFKETYPEVQDIDTIETELFNEDNQKIGKVAISQQTILIYNNAGDLISSD